MIITETSAPPLQLFPKSQSLGTHHSKRSWASSPLIDHRVALCYSVPLSSPSFPRSSKNGLRFLQSGGIFFKNQDQPGHGDIALTRTPRTSSGIIEKRDCCHAITREAGKESARAITRVAGKETGFTPLTRAKSLSKPYFPATTREIHTTSLSLCNFVIIYFVII